jgi:NTE family protein
MLDAQHSDLLRGLTGPELQAVLPLLERRDFAAGETILEWGESGDCLFIVQSGLVTVSIPERGNHRLLAQLGPGQIFGEMALLTGQPRSAQVRAAVDSVVLSLSISSFFSVAGRSPMMLLNIGRVLASRLGHMTRAATQREWRAVTVLVGTSSQLIGSLIATNLTAALAVVSGRRALLLDPPGSQTARLPGRQYAPGLGDLSAGEQTLLHLSQLQVGPVSMHLVSLPDASLNDPATSELLARGVSRLARAVEFPVLNLVGAPRESLEQLVPLANRVYLVATTQELASPECRALLQTCARLKSSSAEFGYVGLLAGDATPTSARQRADATFEASDCVFLPSPAELLATGQTTELPLTIAAPRSPVGRELTRLARSVAGLRIGLALGSGAAKGVAHVGVLAALDRLGVPIDVVTGTSIGALVGAGVAMGMDRPQIAEAMDRLVDLWGEALRPTLPRFSLISPRGLERIVYELAGDVRCEELPLPFGAVATDLLTGRSVHIRQGPVAQAVRASISIPLVFPPVFAGGCVLTDGFVTNPVPAQFARELGADIVLASSLSRREDDPSQAALEFVEAVDDQTSRRVSSPNILETYLRCAEIMMAGRSEHDCIAADLTFRPRLPQMSWKEFQSGGIPMRAGEIAVEEALADLRELLPWLNVAL